MPLHHPPGHAQVDFGEAVVEVGGRREKVAFFCLILPHSNLWFVKAYPRETTEAFLDGHVSAFAFLGGVPRSILYDNTTLAVARILGDGTRRRTQAFTHLQSHYLFRDRFGRPGKGNDKGKVEALVKTARRRFMVPIPKVHDLSVLNERLMARCLERLDALEAGDRATALLGDLDALRDLPAVPFEACEHVPGQISSTALVRYRLVDYSAPTVHAHKKVMVKGYVDRVEIALGAEIVARHRRSYVRGDVIYEPLHYLSLLEKKPGALDQAAPLRGWKLDPAFDTLRRLLEARFGPRGKREYIQVLRLHEDFPAHLRDPRALSVDVLLQPVDLVLVARLGLLLVLVRPAQRDAKIGDLGVLGLDPAFQRLHSPRRGLRCGCLELEPAGVELPRQRARERSGIPLRPAQFLAAQLRHIGAAPFLLDARLCLLKQGFPVEGLAHWRHDGKRPQGVAAVHQRQVGAEILVESRHARDGSACAE